MRSRVPEIRSVDGFLGLRPEAYEVASHAIRRDVYESRKDPAKIYFRNTAPLFLYISRLHGSAGYLRANDRRGSMDPVFRELESLRSDCLGHISENDIVAVEEFCGVGSLCDRGLDSADMDKISGLIRYLDDLRKKEAALKRDNARRSRKPRL